MCNRYCKLLFFGNYLSSTLTLSCITQIYLGCKSKLDADISTNSIFPESYDIFCKDISSSGGAVFSICRSSQQPILVTVEEKRFDVKGSKVIAHSVQFDKIRKLYFTSYYHPPTQDRSSLDLLHNVITRGRDQVWDEKRCSHILQSGHFGGGQRITVQCIFHKVNISEARSEPAEKIIQ